MKISIYAGKLNERIEQLERENAALRDALQQIADAHGNDETTARWCKGKACAAIDAARKEKP